MTQNRARGLSAIMFADIVGYTALMGRDEEAAREQRDRQRDVLERLVKASGGRVLQFYGDGTLSVFPSAVEAARCAVAIQVELRRPPQVPLRIGLHVGDVVEDGGGVYGDAVNVAARVESLAATGGVAVSGKFFDEIKNHPDLPAISLGTVRLKNVSRPLEIFALTGSGLPVPDPGHLRGAGGPMAPGADEGRGVRARHVGTAIAAVVLLALGMAFAWERYALGPADPVLSASDRGSRSIAVLPFRNLSEESENAAFFADGIHDDILTQLAKVRSLEVIARTSVMRYAGSELPVPVIGRELGVATVLEGGVQRAGNRIRLNVQLIDARTDAHMWAETYDRELTTENVFAIQSEVAQAIARELSAVISGDERRALAGVPTDNLEAYDLYLLGSAAMRRYVDLRDLQVAQEAFQEAATVDPDFALAFARLTYVHVNTYWDAYDRSVQRLELAAAALRRAEELDPTHPEVLLARGYYEYWGRRDYAAALAALGEAERRLPGNARLHEARGYVLRRLGSWEEAVPELEKAVTLDPLNSELVRALGETHMYMGQFDSARVFLERALAVDPMRWTATFDLGRVSLLRDGDVKPLEAGLAEVSAVLGDRIGTIEYWRWWVEYVEGDDSAASSIAADAPRVLELQTVIYPRSLLNALMHNRRGRRAQTLAAADSARAVLESLLRTQALDPRVHTALGTALALAGRRDEAVRAGQMAVDLMPVSRDAMDGPEYGLNLARIHALLGEADAALDLLDRVLSVPTANSLTSVLLDPAFAEMRDHPRVTRR